MDIVSRLKLFMELNKISNSQLADTCKIPRPTVSQLLNGRNKKVSDEVISRIHASYPALSIMWLMFGEEPMLMEKVSGGNVPNRNMQKSPAVKLRENSLFPDEVDDYQEDGNLTASGADKRAPRSGDAAVSAPRAGAFDSGGSMVSQMLENFAKNAGQRSPGGHDSLSGGQKKIVNVMVFYSDNSFETFVPDR